jgi:hypothetical protein
MVSTLQTQSRARRISKALRRRCPTGMLGLHVPDAEAIGLGFVITGTERRERAAAGGGKRRPRFLVSLRPVMRLWIGLAFSVALTAPAAAQAVATTAPAAAGSSASASGPGLSTAPAATVGTSSSTAGSTATAPAAASNVAPAWILCLPPGATGEQPFLEGTDLSCAPQ